MTRANGSNRLAILTSGGDAPGMNGAIRAATLVAAAQGWEVLGIRHGYRGLLDWEVEPLGPRDVEHILRQGGTVLGSARCPEMLECSGRDQARRRLTEEEIEALIVVGGSGSLMGACALSDNAEGALSTRVAAISATIDNDVVGAGMSIGVDTAMNTIVEACDKIADTADALERTFLVEVMGRGSGYLAQTAGIGASANLILFPEAGLALEQLVDRIVQVVRKVHGRSDRSRRVVILKAEGVDAANEEIKQRVDDRLSELESVETETRVVVLGHVQRGGRPSAFDRLLASRFGQVAATALLEGKHRFMAGWRVTEPERLGAERSSADPYCWLVPLPAVVEETERRLRGEGELVAWRNEAFARLDALLGL